MNKGVAALALLLLFVRAPAIAARLGQVRIARVRAATRRGAARQRIVFHMLARFPALTT
jgi:hypothetical protein